MTLQEFILANYKKFKEEKTKELHVEDNEYLQGVIILLKEKNNEFNDAMELGAILSEQTVRKFLQFQVINHKKIKDKCYITIKKETGIK